MKKRLKLKPYVMPTVYVMLVSILAIGMMSTFEDVPVDKEDLNYVSDNLNNNEIPVISTTETLIIKPFNSEGIKIGKNFYDYTADESQQNNAIVYYENTYIQNSGIDYIKEDIFEVLSILDGTVVSVSQNELLGNTIEIKHDHNLISIYQSLSLVNVKEGDAVKQGQIIGKSGTSKLNKSLGNHLHFELFNSGRVVNPETYYGLNIKDI